MRVRPHDAGNVKVNIATRLWSPFAREVNRDTASFSRHSFDVYPAPFLSKVVVYGPCKASDPFKYVEGNHEVNPWNLRQAVLFKVLIQANKGDQYHDAMDAQESLVEGMAKG